MAINPEHHTWPQSLISACALDDLSRQLYEARQGYYGLPDKPWASVPFHVKQAYVETAKRILDAVQPLTHQETSQASGDKLFALATTLARCYRPAVPGKVIGAIAPAIPWGTTERCLYCGDPIVETIHEPYCGKHCAMRAEREN